jgi:membrane dipeptidase
MTVDHGLGSDTWVMDGHNDLAWAMRELCSYDFDAVDLVGGEPRLQTDLPRLRAGGVGAQFWSVYVPGSMPGGLAVKTTLEQVDFVRRLAARYPEHFALATTAAEVESVVATSRIACLLGMEGGHSIDSSLAALRMMHALGVRYMTLTHNENVPWADSATDVPAVGGLTEFGRDVVREMNRIGMFVDLSHVTADVMRDALDTASAPVIFSHSCARSICDIGRNVPDDVLQRLRSNGGVCMVTHVAMFVSQRVADWYLDSLDQIEAAGGDRRSFADIDPFLRKRRETDPAPECTVEELADHVERVREVAGLDHVGIGGDYDGSSEFPRGMADVSGYPLLFDTLRRRGWSRAELRALAHGNVLRAMRDMDDVAG